MRRFFALVLLALGLLLPVVGRAEPVEHRLSSGVMALAEYYAAAPGRPTVLLLPPFLQTHRFPTVANLALTLSESGYGVLVPTLSLGIDYRRQSLACEAIHTRTFDENSREISDWLGWLQLRGIEQVVGAGHSYGNLYLLFVASQAKRGSMLSRLILTSPVYIDTASGVLIDDHQLSRAQAAERAGEADVLERYVLSYCKNFTATRSVYLSLAQWDRDHVLALMRGVTVPMHAVIGSADEYQEAVWPEILQQAGVQLHMVEGANHFFADDSEFALADTVEAILRASP